MALESNEMVVKNGPSKFDLMVSLFEGNPTPRHTVRFTVEGFKRDLDVAITSVQQESGDGNSWNIAGLTAGLQVAGYYSTAHCCGILQFIPRMEVRSDPSKQEASPLDQERITSFLTSSRKRKSADWECPCGAGLYESDGSCFNCGRSADNK